MHITAQVVERSAQLFESVGKSVSSTGARPGRSAWALRFDVPTLAISLLWCGTGTSSCSLFVDAERTQCATDRDCSTGPRALAGGVCIESLCEVAPEWSCVGPHPGQAGVVDETTMARLALTPGSGPLDMTLPVVDALTETPANGVDAMLCRKIDVDCETPVARMSTNSEGAFSLSMDEPFDGYLRIEAPDHLPALYFLSAPLWGGERLPAISLWDAATATSLVSDLDVELSMDDGVALLTTQDCLGGLSAGVTYEAAAAAPATRAFYATDGLPSVRAAQTDGSGYGGFVNLPPGPVSISGHLAGSEKPLATVSMLIRPGFISYGRIAPSSHHVESDAAGPSDLTP